MSNAMDYVGLANILEKKELIIDKKKQISYVKTDTSLGFFYDFCDSGKGFVSLSGKFIGLTIYPDNGKYKITDFKTLNELCEENNNKYDFNKFLKKYQNNNQKPLIDYSNKELFSMNFLQKIFSKIKTSNKDLDEIISEENTQDIEVENLESKEMVIFKNKVPACENLNKLNLSYDFLTNNKYLTNPAICREEQIENLEIALLTPSKSAILVGPPGVGKTAIVEGLAYKIKNKQVPQILQNKKILKINTSSIVSGCNLVGMVEEKMEKLMKYLMENPNIILFIDEIHTTIGAGTGNKSNLDLANMMKPYLDHGQIKIIGATTEEEYSEYIKSDKAFNRRFKRVTISEPKDYIVSEIMRNTIKKLEKTTEVKWSFEDNTSEMILSHITEYTGIKYRTYKDKRCNPDISLTILETAFAMALLKENKNVSIENISDAIKKSEFLYDSIKDASAEELLSKYNAMNPETHKNSYKSKILDFKIRRQ